MRYPSRCFGKWQMSAMRQIKTKKKKPISIIEVSHGTSLFVVWKGRRSCFDLVGNKKKTGSLKLMVSLRSWGQVSCFCTQFYWTPTFHWNTTSYISWATWADLSNSRPSIYPSAASAQKSSCVYSSTFLWFTDHIRGSARAVYKWPFWLYFSQKDGLRQRIPLCVAIYTGSAGSERRSGDFTWARTRRDGETKQGNWSPEWRKHLESLLRVSGICLRYFQLSRPSAK